MVDTHSVAAPVDLTSQWGACAPDPAVSQIEVGMEGQPLPSGKQPAIHTQGCSTLVADADYVGVTLQQQSSGSWFGELCGQMTASFEELGQSCAGTGQALNAQAPTQIVASIGNDPAMDVTEVAKTWTPALSPNSPFA